MPNYKKMLKSRIMNLCRAFVMLSAIFCPSLIYAANVVSVQSINITPYNDAFKGVESSCNCNVKQFVLSEMRSLDIIREVRSERPDVIITIGIGALKKINVINDIPIVYLMVLNTQSLISGKDNISGIRMNILPERQLDMIYRALPNIRDLGLIYNPEQTGKYVEDILNASGSKGFKVTAKEVRSNKEIPVQLSNMKGVINAFWMLPDVSVMTPETVEILFLYSLKNKVPVITFSKKYLEMGALMSMDVDAYDMGKQAAEIVGKILSGTDIRKIPNTSARKINITINRRAVKKLGVTVSDKILKESVLVH